MAIAKAVSGGASSAGSTASDNNSNNPKAKSLISLSDDTSKGDTEHASKIQEAVKARVDE